MNITRRFTLLMKGNLNALLDSLEDPERSLNQLILDMEEELEAAKRAAAKAMANEDVLRNRIAFQEREAAEWEEAAERSLAGDEEEEARDALRRAEQAQRTAGGLREQLEAQEKESADIRTSVARMNERVGQARARLHLLQAKMRQGEARRAVNRVMRGVEARNLHADFDRIGARVEQEAAAEAAYHRIDDELSGEDLRRRREVAAVDEAVESRLAALRERLADEAVEVDDEKAAGETPTETE